MPGGSRPTSACGSYKAEQRGQLLAEVRSSSETVRAVAERLGVSASYPQREVLGCCSREFSSTAKDAGNASRVRNAC
jgi:hypothetical protein